MSLQVWLPLNGDLHNQGLGNYSISLLRGTQAFDEMGKIGQCFNANGVNTIQINNIIPDFYNYSGYSLCAWFYINAQNTSHSGSAIISAGNWNKQILNLVLSGWSSDHYTQLQVSGTSWNKIYNYNFNKNTWYHVVVSSDGNKTYAYVNGFLIGDTLTGFLPSSIEGNNIAIGGATYYSGMQFFGKINDVRIYNHCLSAKEVEEISKGLVLHYKLDNVINNIVYDCSGYNYNSKIIGAYSLNTTSARYSKNLFMNNTNTANHIETLQDILYDKTYLTISCWVKADKSKSQVIFVQPNIEFGFLNNLAYVNTVSSAPFSLTNYKNNEWNHIVVIKNNTNYELYINGKKETRGGANNYYLHNGNKLYLLNRNYNNNYAGNANISDFRIYITILTEEQILELYNTSATIDKNGNIYSREMVEE